MWVLSVVLAIVVVALLPVHRLLPGGTRRPLSISIWALFQAFRTGDVNPIYQQIRKNKTVLKVGIPFKTFFYLVDEVSSDQRERVYKHHSIWKGLVKLYDRFVPVRNIEDVVLKAITLNWEHAYLDKFFNFAVQDLSQLTSHWTPNGGLESSLEYFRSQILTVALGCLFPTIPHGQRRLYSELYRKCDPFSLAADESSWVTSVHKGHWRALEKMMLEYGHDCVVDEWKELEVGELNAVVMTVLAWVWLMVPAQLVITLAKAEKDFKIAEEIRKVKQQLKDGAWTRASVDSLKRLDKVMEDSENIVNGAGILAHTPIISTTSLDTPSHTVPSKSLLLVHQPLPNPAATLSDTLIKLVASIALSDFDIGFDQEIEWADRVDNKGVRPVGALEQFVGVRKMGPNGMWFQRLEK